MTLPNISLLCPSLLADRQDRSKGLAALAAMSCEVLLGLDDSAENRDRVSLSNVSVTDIDAERSCTLERPENSVLSGRTETDVVVCVLWVEALLLFANEKRRLGEALRLSIAGFVPL